MRASFCRLSHYLKSDRSDAEWLCNLFVSGLQENRWGCWCVVIYPFYQLTKPLCTTLHRTMFCAFVTSKLLKSVTIRTYSYKYCAFSIFQPHYISHVSFVVFPFLFLSFHKVTGFVTITTYAREPIIHARSCIPSQTCHSHKSKPSSI